MGSDALTLDVPPELIAVALGLLGLLIGIIAYLLAEHTGPRARLRTRLAAISGSRSQSESGRPASKRNRQLEARLKEAGRSNGRGSRIDMRLRLDQAGLSIPVRTFYMGCAASGILGTLIYLLLGQTPLSAVAVALVMTIGLPKFVLNFITSRRQRQFTKLFADAIDVIVRGIRSGLPVGECLNIIARESPDPVGPEFKLMIEGQRLGMTLKQALERACRRMPTADMKFFAVVLNLQQQTGGNLAETLAGLSGVLRGRKKMADKIRAMSSEARMTATIIGALPFLVALAIYAINPGYIALLWTDPMGKMILYGGLSWMAIGIFIMKQMVSFEI